MVWRCFCRRPVYSQFDDAIEVVASLLVVLDKEGRRYVLCTVMHASTVYAGCVRNSLSL